MAATKRAKSACSAGKTCSAAARPSTTKANSPPGPNINPVLRAEGRLMPNKGPKPAMIAALTPISPSMAKAMSSGRSNIFAISTLMPTDTRNTPSNSPLKGSMVVSISRRYSVSARRSPAINAPSAIDSPAAALPKAVAITTNRQAAIKISGLLVRAAWRNTGRNTRRPMTMVSPTARIATKRL